MKMNDYYTHIPQKSYKAYVNDRQNLDQVLCALIVDPDDAADAAKEYGLELPHSLEDFQSYSLKFVEMMKQTLAQWVMTNANAQDAMPELTRWNIRVGTACACAVARSVQKYLGGGWYDRSESQMRAAEAWVDGSMDKEKMRSIVRENAPPSSLAQFSRLSWLAATSSNRAATVPVLGSYAAATSVRYAADAIYEANDASSRDDALVRLREVVANACLSFQG